MNPSTLRALTPAITLGVASFASMSQRTTAAPCGIGVPSRFHMGLVAERCSDTQTYFDDRAFAIVVLTYGIAAISAAVAVLSSAI